jgi:hypothetical protein
VADVVTLESLALRNTRLLHEIGSMHEELIVVSARARRIEDMLIELIRTSK